MGLVWLFCLWPYFDGSCECCLKVCRGQHFESRRAGPLKDAFVIFQEELARDEPVTINCATTKTWTIYADGAFEPDGEIRASVGAVLVSPDGLVVERFGLKLPDSLTSEFEKDSKHPICELEIFPILPALRVWQRHLLNAQIVFYLDNDAARSGMIRAKVSTRLAQSPISELVSLRND